MSEETPLLFGCGDDELIGILHRPQDPGPVGVLIVVGGPQYRVGSHRQFLLLARYLAGRGTPVLRFDYRGMGDSGGEFKGFEHIDDDIRAALDCLIEQVPQIERVVLWGLCDAASAAMMYAHTDRRVSAMVLLNPWVRTESGQAKTLLRHYYLQRLASADFWRRLISGRLAIGTMLRSLLSNVRDALSGSRTPPVGGQRQPFLQRMAQGLEAFEGSVRLIISGDDLTAAEFTDMVSNNRNWQRILDRPTFDRQLIPDATHTCSSAQWRRQVEEWTGEWVERA